MRHRALSVALLVLFLTALPLTRGEAKPPKPPPVSNPVIVYQCEGICVANEDGTAARPDSCRGTPVLRAH